MRFHYEALQRDGRVVAGLIEASSERAAHRDLDRSGLRLRLLKSQAEAGDIALLFQDESEALTHPYLARAWAKRGSDLRVEAPGQARKRALIGVLDCAAYKLIVSTSDQSSAATSSPCWTASTRFTGLPGTPG